MTIGRSAWTSLLPRTSSGGGRALRAAVSKDGHWRGLARGGPSSFESLRTPTFGRLLRTRLMDDIEA